MALTREDVFTINLGEVVNTRLESFVLSRKKIRAAEEAKFQRRIIEENLSYEDQLNYRLSQIEAEKRSFYPDEDRINELEKEVAFLKKIIRLEKIKDNYYKKALEATRGLIDLEEVKNYLEDEYANAVDEETKKFLQGKLIQVYDDLEKRRRKIIDDQIDFLEKDKTYQSIDEAIRLIQKELNKPETSKIPELYNVYNLRLNALKKRKQEIEIKDVLNSLNLELVAKDYNYKSLYKLNRLQQIIKTADDSIPISIDGVNYSSAKQYWQSLLNDYISSNFVSEFSNEVKNNLNLSKSKIGEVSDIVLTDISSQLKNIKTNPVFRDHPQVIDEVVKTVSALSMEEKVKDIKKQYGFDEDNVSFHKIWQGKEKLKNYQQLFPDISFQPFIQTFEDRELKLKGEETQEIIKAAYEYQERHPKVSFEEAVEKVAPMVSFEISREELLSPASPKEIAKKTEQKIKETPSITETQQLEREKTMKKEEEKNLEKTSGRIVEVKEGETLWSIAERELGEGKRWKELKTPEGKEFNEEEAKKLQVGQKIVIPEQ